MKHLSLLLLVLQALLQITIRTSPCAEDDLPRRPFVGVQLDAKDGQVKIGRIFPNSSASRSGLKVDDVVLAIDETKITTVSEFLAAMKRFRTGDHVKCAIVRDTKNSFVEVTLTEWPRETPDGFKVLYDQVPAGAKSLRCLVTRPPQAAEGKVPAVFYIQGIDCASIEHPFPGPNHMRDFVYELSRAGFAVMRSEKSGIGDSSGPDCKHLGLDEEVADFTAALKKLKSYDFVDSNKVFLFGHSAGGWVAPLVAVNEQVAGVAVYGTVVRPFGEYLVENHRRNKWHRNHPDPAELELEVRRMGRLWHLLLEERRTSAETLKAEPALTDVAKHVFRGEPDCPYDVRSLGYFRDVHDRNMPAVWGKLRVPVLAMMGQYEVRTSEFEHQYIADIVNYYAPGNATWKVLPKLDHGFAVHDSMQDAVDNEFQGPFGNTVVAQSVEWMKAVVQGLDSEIKKQ